MRIYSWLITSLVFAIGYKYHFLTIIIDYMWEKKNLELDHKVIDPKIFIKENDIIRDDEVKHRLENKERFVFICVGVLLTITVFSVTGIIYLDFL